uniref:Albumin domain-containing protein n=1 Tax=Pyxicephalus adspersus TaxID=30357 RepID=A0AAV3ALK3_PYXAD|nr:TPA: hypothetical protein GDO54_009001 [Pyxicephalus adspersus]
MLVLVAQDFQKCSLDEHLKLQAKLMEVVNECVEHPEEAKCKTPAMTLYHDTVCKEDLEAIYPWTTECCAKEEAERITCFRNHRDSKVEEYKIPDVEQACKDHKENPQHAFSYYISNIGRRHPRLFPSAVLGFAITYNQITTECCQAENKEKCFGERMPQVKKLTNFVEDTHKQKCRILDYFPERVSQAQTLVQVSQKFPHADFADVQKLTLETVHLIQDCCRGDAVECLMERMEETDHICADHKKYSDKLGDCCAKDGPERTRCILALPDDDGSDISKDLTKYYEGEHVCEDYQKGKQNHLAHFTYEYSRTHQESSSLSCLRVAKKYEEMVEKCCAGEHRAECLKEAPKLLAAQKENEELIKQNCGGLAQHGVQDFYVGLLYRYFKKMPQVTSPTLVDIAGRMTKIGVYCCSLPDNKKQPCAEEKLDIVLGEMCESGKQVKINEGVDGCCRDSYSFRRPCFTKLEPDTKYVAPAWDESKLHFSADLCDGTAAQQQEKKLILLADYLKMKPDLGAEKLKEVVESFRKIVEKCCAAESHEVCFNLEKPGLLAVVTH